MGDGLSTASRWATHAAGASLTAAGLWQNRHFIHDDAYISLRYADALLRRGELTWNPGERVEGYTNFLHVVASAGLGALGVPLERAPQVVNLVSLVALGLVFGVGLRADARRHPGGWPLAGPVATWSLLASYPLLTWVWGGLEAPLVAALLGGVLVFLVTGNDRPAGALAGLAVLARPDAVLPGGLALVLLGRPRAVAIAVTVALPHLLWRRWYYGEWFPNTFFAKVAGVDPWGGLRYLREFSMDPPLWPYLVLLACLGALTGPRRRLAGALVAVVLSQIGFVAWSGGDHMPAHRMLVPVLPALALLLYLGLRRIRHGAAALVVWAALALQPWFVGGQAPDRAARFGKMAGLWIHDRWPAGSLVALNTAGSTPFFNPDMHFVDMLGLNDRTIARRVVVALETELPWQARPGHAKGDGAYVLSREPDYIILGPAMGKRADDPWFLSDLELARSEEFARCYQEQQATVPLPAEDERLWETFTWFERRCP